MISKLTLKFSMIWPWKHLCLACKFHFQIEVHDQYNNLHQQNELCKECFQETRVRVNKLNHLLEALQVNGWWWFTLRNSRFCEFILIPKYWNVWNFKVPYSPLGIWEGVENCFKLERSTYHSNALFIFGIQDWICLNIHSNENSYIF